MARLLPALVLAVIAAMLPAADAHARTVWLCKPGLESNPCEAGLKTTVFSPAGQQRGTVAVRHDRPRRIDCFYVYPTVSDQKAPFANLHRDPEIRSIALFHAARFAQRCRVFAPMYHQRTIASLAGLEALRNGRPYRDVVAAWHDYLRRYNDGRGVVLIGHSQGSVILRRLVANEIDAKPVIRRRLVSAILLGGNMLVKRGRDSGGDFKHVKACRRERQLRCVMAWSTFDAPVPQNALFGRTPRKGMQVLCTNPAALGGGSGELDPIYPSVPFAPGTLIAVGISLLGYPLPDASTPWISVPGSFRAHCSSGGGANVLQVSSVGGAPTLKPSPDSAWGLHLADLNLALGNLLAVVRTETAAYAKRH